MSTPSIPSSHSQCGPTASSAPTPPHPHAHAHGHAAGDLTCNHTASPKTQEPLQDAHAVTKADRDAGDGLRDPVCGMTVKADTPHHADHAEQRYRFCSAGCRAKFVAAPERYLHADSSQAPATVPAPAAAGTQYTCPMHPEIVQDSPGTCPICGMALEPMMPSLDDNENPELTDFRRRFWWTVPLSIVVLALAMVGHRWPGLSASARTWLELVLSAPVVLWAGWPFFQRWAQSIANRSPNMWTLIGTGVGAAFGYSLVATLAPDLFPTSFQEHGRVFEHAARIVVAQMRFDLVHQIAHTIFPSPDQADKAL